MYYVMKQDVDECTTGLNDCHINAECTKNTENSYNCTCKSGFKGNGFNCCEYFLQCFPGIKLYHNLNYCAACEEQGVHLFGGDTTNEGQVGVCINNTYLFICKNFLGERVAQVICHQLNLDGSGHSVPVSGTYFKNGTAGMGMTSIGDVRCLGNELSLSECAMDFNADCDQSDIAGVICQHPGITT